MYKLPLIMNDWLTRVSNDLSQGIFVTGTDTGVGKTWVSCYLIQVLTLQGLAIQPCKPVESGWLVENPQNTDAGKLAHAAQVNMESVCGYRFLAPLSPPRAAQLEGKNLSIKALFQQCQYRINDNKILWIEGAGGFYSPIAEDGLNADLAQTLGLPVLLVGNDKVGGLNHVLLVLEAAQRRNLNIIGIILNRQEPVPEHMDNVADLQALTTIPVFTTADWVKV